MTIKISGLYDDKEVFLYHNGRLFELEEYYHVNKGDSNVGRIVLKVVDEND